MYKFSWDIYFANAPHLTIFAILISQMAACSSKLIPYAYTFLRFYFHKHPLICKIRKNKVPQKFVRIRYFMGMHTLHMVHTTKNSFPQISTVDHFSYLVIFTLSPANIAAVVEKWLMHTYLYTYIVTMYLMIIITLF